MKRTNGRSAGFVERGLMDRSDRRKRVHEPRVRSAAAPMERASGSRRSVALLVLAILVLSPLGCISSDELGFETVAAMHPGFAGLGRVAERTDFGMRVQVEQYAGLVVYDLVCSVWEGDYHLEPRRHSGTLPRRTIFEVHVPETASREARFFWVTSRGWFAAWQRSTARPSQRVEVELTRNAVFDEQDASRTRVDCG